MSSKGVLPSKIANKQKRQELVLKQKRAQEKSKREERFRRRKEEDKNPRLRIERRARNIPATIERKRIWDKFESEDEDGLGLSVDVERIKRQKNDQQVEDKNAIEGQDIEDELRDDDAVDDDSMIDSGTDTDEDEAGKGKTRQKDPTATERATSPTRSTASTNLSLMPDALAAKFPTLFTQEPRTPKILITTSINSNLHYEAELLTTLFPNAVYIRRSAHRYAHKYSVREIATYASNRHYTAVVVLMEDQKRPTGLDIVHLPEGPMKLPGHGNPTNHYPELILNNFRTPLGLLTAHLWKSMFPPIPEFQGRQVVTLHNQRDYIFVRRHRYVFRDKKASEKVLQGADGKEIKGAESLRVGLQELGPRFTLKLRRIDKKIQRASDQEWEWKGRTDKVRTKFQL
ncbi:hypothetical protein MMC10_009118 [Thelotrema lepadinum]|nr:hypothetical protein [Thelotrema lepadinum]